MYSRCLTKWCCDLVRNRKSMLMAPKCTAAPLFQLCDQPLSIDYGHTFAHFSAALPIFIKNLRDTSSCGGITYAKTYQCAPMCSRNAYQTPLYCSLRFFIFRSRGKPDPPRYPVCGLFLSFSYVALCVYGCEEDPFWYAVDGRISDD